MEDSSPKALLPEGYFYNPEGYLWYLLPKEKFAALPESVQVHGDTLTKKSEFHVTVVNARNIARDIVATDSVAAARIEERLQLLLTTYASETPIVFTGFEDDLRLAVKEGRTSIAARCRMKNMEGYFDRITSEFGKEYPLQPVHVSVYTATGQAVGINSIEEMESYEKINLPEIQSILTSISST